MKNIIYFGICYLLFFSMNAQTLNCNKFCVTNISLDSVTGEMLVTIYNGDTVHVNYPTVQVIDMNGDTVGNPDGLYFFFAHLPGYNIVHSIPTTLTSLPAGFAATLLYTDQIWNVTCTFSYPMNCFAGQPHPDCDDLTVENIQIDSVASTMDVTLFNNCTNCSSGMSGPVYCEMKVIRTIAPYDTLAEANCYCFVTPDNLSYNTYTLTSYVNTLPSINDIKVIFHCGSGLCDTLQIDPSLGVTEYLSVVNLNIFPNPTSGKFTVNVALSEQGIKSKSKVKFELRNISGRIIYEQNLILNTRIIKIDLPDFIDNGIYNCMIQKDELILGYKRVVVSK